MRVAADVLSEMDTDLVAPRSVRTSGHTPWTKHVPAEQLAAVLPSLIEEELRAVDDGRLAVLLPPERLDEIGESVTRARSDAVVGTQPEGLESPAVLLTIEQAKGLEFDAVLLVDPDGVLAESEQGLNDIYVGLTRATQRLGVVHTDGLPEVLSDLNSS